MEMWKDVIGYEGLYEISDQSRFRSLDRVIFREMNGKIFPNNYKGKNLVKRPARKGYWHVALTDTNGIRKDWLTHVLLASHFIPNPGDLPEVNHIDGIKSNDNINNLEWCTRSQNQEHAYELGLNNKQGENNGRSKLSEKHIPIIREMLHHGFGPTIISQYFTECPILPNITSWAVSDIKRNKTWQHI